MKKLKVGVVGYRGMVGSVFLERLFEEGDYIDFELGLLSTTQAGAPVQDDRIFFKTVGNALDVSELLKFEVIVSCQGGDYTTEMVPKLISEKFQGYWVDAASTLRMNDDAMIVLDPINGTALREGISRGVKFYAGGNCTVSLLLMALDGLLKEDLVEWVSSQTYQAASGAGAAAMESLVHQMGDMFEKSKSFKNDNPSIGILEIEKKLVKHQKTLEDLPMGAPLAANLIPWIDTELENGQSREEWKALIEANKILGRSGDSVIAIDGNCVRVGAMRCHSQALTIKLKKDLPLDMIGELLANAHEWIRFVPNHKPQTLKELTPLSVSGTLDIAIGRVRKSQIGPEYLSAFTIGDQLLWGAAEPLRRFLRILREEIAISTS